MEFYKQSPQGPLSATGQAAAYDQGLRGYMLQIYNYMASALALTGLTAWFVSNTPAVANLFYVTMERTAPDGETYLALAGMTPLGWVIAFAPLAFSLFLGFRINKMSFQAAQAAFWAFAFVMGLSMANIFFFYTGASIAKVFFITAAMFGGLSLYGYTTKRNMTGLGSFLMMGIIGLIIASIVNIFLKSSGLDFAVSVLGVLIFSGLTAYDTQRLKQLYYAEGQGYASLGHVAIMGALQLYLDFINLFLMMLRFFGDRR